jgi:hypothetical protein
LHDVARGKQSQVPWSIVQPYLTSTIALIGKVLQQPPMSDILHHIQDAAKCTQNIQRDVTVIKSSVGLSTAPPGAVNFSGGRFAAGTWAKVAAQATGPSLPLPPIPQDVRSDKPKTIFEHLDSRVT